MTFSFIRTKLRKSKQTTVLINKPVLIYVGLHFRMASPFYMTQLVDMFAYELLTGKIKDKAPHNVYGHQVTSVFETNMVYNFHSLYSHERLVVMVGSYNPDSTLNSLSELFFSANWLEREVAELFNLHFFGKKDLRNLMLQYGDSTAPFLKSFPSIGLREMFYDPIKDTIVQRVVSVQS